MAVDLRRLQWPQVLALSTGIVLIVWGLAGFLFDLQAGVALSALHVVTGIGLIVSTPRLRWLRGTGLLLAVLYFVLFGIGAAGFPPALLHLVIGLASVAAAEGSVWCLRCARALSGSEAGGTGTAQM